MLTTDQLKHLKTDLSQIKYDETFHEFLDHYATLTEQDISAGNDFETARTLAMNQLGGQKKLVALEEKMLTQWQASVSERAWRILLDCFRWPSILLTLLAGGIAYLITTRISTTTAFVVTGVLAILPITIDFLKNIIPSWVAYRQGKRDRNLSIRQRGLWQLFVPINLIFQIINITRIFTKDASPVAQQVNQIMIVLALSFMIVYSFSIFKLYRERLILNY